jgi:hypothetical protein
MNEKMKAAYLINAVQGVAAALLTAFGWWMDSPITVAVGGIFLIEATLWRGLRGPNA